MTIVVPGIFGVHSVRKVSELRGPKYWNFAHAICSVRAALVPCEPGQVRDVNEQQMFSTYFCLELLTFFW